MQEMCRKCHLHNNYYGFSHHMIYPSFLCSGNVPNTSNFLCSGMCPTHQIFCVQEICMKCHLSYFAINYLIFSFMPDSVYRKYEGNVLEMSCVLATGNVPEISCVLVQEMCLKFCPILHQEKSRKCQNFLVLEMSMPCELSCKFHGISFPRKFRISSSTGELKSAQTRNLCSLFIGKLTRIDCRL